jgi:hypothetical protein
MGLERRASRTVSQFRRRDLPEQQATRRRASGARKALFNAMFGFGDTGEFDRYALRRTAESRQKPQPEKSYCHDYDRVRR